MINQKRNSSIRIEGNIDLKKLKKRIPGLPFWALLYTYAGVILWLLEWVKPGFSIMAIGLLFFGLCQFMKTTPRGEGVRIALPVLIFSALLLFLWTVLCGSGGIFAQQFDWDKHNAILHDLISKGWPVYYHNDNSNAMLTYYIGQYLIPAAAGKLTGSFRVGELVMLIWNFIGVYLTALLLFRLTNANTWRKQIFCVVCFYFL